MAVGNSRSVLIVGAGIGGLAAGIALQQAGWQVRIVERAANPRELGFALLLAPNAIASLRRLGVADAVIAGGAVPAVVEMRGPGGRVLRFFDATVARPLLPEPPVVVLRPVLHGILLERVGRDALALSAPAIGLGADRRRPVLHLESGEALDADVIVGADGIGSVVRRTLHPDEPPPRRSGLWGVRGVAHDVDGHLADVSALQYFGRGIESGVSRAGGGAVYWYISVPVSRVGASRDPLAIARSCAQEFDDTLGAIVAATNPDEARLDELVDREPLDEWGSGAVTLLGDAAHPMVPHAGQGAAQALEDAVALGRVLTDTAEIEPALRRYERVRAERTRTIIGVARRNARMGSIENPLGCWARNLAIRWIPESVLLKQYVAFGTPPEV